MSIEFDREELILLRAATERHRKKLIRDVQRLNEKGKPSDRYAKKLIIAQDLVDKLNKLLATKA